MLLSELISTIKPSQMIALYLPMEYSNPFVYTQACLIPKETAENRVVNELNAIAQVLPDFPNTTIVLHVRLA